MNAIEMWNLFKEHMYVQQNARYEAWSFGCQADELAQLTVDGIKTGTASAYPMYEIEKEALPQVGGFDIILNSRDEAVCITETTKVYVVPFCEVSREHAYKEGEGDRSLEYWRKVHEVFFSDCLKEGGLSFDKNMPVVCQEYKVVFNPLIPQVSKVADTKTVEYIFDGWKETMIWSCLQGVMGEIYTNNFEHPESAMAVLGDFIFFAGKPEKALVLYKPEKSARDFKIMVPSNDQWGSLIEACYQERAKKATRYATKKAPLAFDKEMLKNVVSALPDEYEIKMIDEELYHMCKASLWSEDLVSQFNGYDMYQKLGLGVVIVKEGQIVSGASSYTRYAGGIEIEIDTEKEYRRRGLACICGAKLILECLDRKLYPSWDAQNLWSVALAEKLGYRLDFAYNVYVYRG